MLFLKVLCEADLHRGYRTYLLQQVLAPGVISLRVNLLMRYRTFFQSLLDSPSPEVQVAVRLAARDLRSSVGSNLAILRQESGGLDPWTVSAGKLKAALIKKETVAVPAQDEWRIPLLRQLLAQRLKHFYDGDKVKEESISRLIDSLVVN